MAPGGGVPQRVRKGLQRSYETQAGHTLRRSYDRVSSLIDFFFVSWINKQVLITGKSLLLARIARGATTRHSA